MLFQKEVEITRNILQYYGLQESIIFSPISILLGLGIWYIGSRGKTSEEIYNVLGMTEEEFFKKMPKLYEVFKNKNSIKIQLHHKIFYSNLCDLIINFIEKFQNNFKGEICKLDLASVDSAVKVINDYIYLSSNKRINNVITKDDFEFNPDVIAISILHFIGPWKDNFNKRHIETFFSSPNRKIEMMKKIVTNALHWNFVENKNWCSLGIPYDNSEAWFYIVLPNENYSLSELIQNVTDKSFLEWTEKLNFSNSIFNRYCKIEVTIPLINASTKFEMKPLFEALGIKTAFTETADFSEMIAKPGKIQKIIHAANITVDEEGTEASSLTLGQRIPVNKTVYKFVANRPFLYFIAVQNYREETELFNLLFVGIYN